MRLSIYFTLLFTAAILTGCKDQGVDVDERIIPDQNVSWSQHIQPVLEFHCVPCHNEQTREAGLSLTSWASATSDLSVIVPFNADNSKLVWAVEGRSGVFFMPPIGSPYKPLNQNQINGIKIWINEGAKSN
jgi:hypothetical protein